ncbi:uncharacterized mitochondrial protein AtMg00810-like [Carya illinoinensis]|uniref:uncharacterized mitochondrial protein AtMg00810-like n=1 Tax=Carya illinoinensis TaxID=32201 RepID=UPI001C729237|nr:uncharacterized mitochondrial protein AtMg00810-like [Carya illinoinensis]
MESSVDKSLFIYVKDGLQLFVLVYVDDIIITGSNKEAITRFIAQLGTKFHLKDLGSLNYFLGVQASRDSNGLHLRQSKHILDLLHKTGMAGAKPISSPSTFGKKLTAFDGDLLPDPSQYRMAVGALQYCTISRPDIAYIINQLCQFMHSPHEGHWTSLKRVLRYLKGTIDYGLYYTPSVTELHAFCDFDWAGNPDDRRSSSGYGIFLSNNLISWSAKKQSVVSRSSTEAEYRSLALVTAKLYWMIMLFKELNITLPKCPIIWFDNIGAFALASNLVFHARTKHIEVDYHFLREKVLNKDIQVKHISIANQIADVFTKGQTAMRFKFLRSKLMIWLLPISLQGGVRLNTTEDLSQDLT